MKVDYLIAGQGISGSVIALRLNAMGKSVAIINEPALSSSSAIAAGVYNPFNFRRSVPTWEAAKATEEARIFYSDAEELLSTDFHSSREIVRVFGSEAERGEWENYLQNDNAQFAQRAVNATMFNAVKTPFGYGVLNGGGVLHTKKFLQATHGYFNNRGYYFSELVDFSLVKITGNTISYDDRIQARRIIFAEGHLAENNPYFNPKIIAPTKGELLHVEIPGAGLTGIVNGPVYLAPLGDDQYVCGATFNPGKRDEELTGQGREELLSKLRSMTDLPIKVINHFAGVRPAGRDRKPVLGVSKQNENIAIFNGMGSKAVMLAPYLSQLLVNHLENGAGIPAEISVTRFKDSK